MRHEVSKSRGSSRKYCQMRQCRYWYWFFTERQTRNQIIYICIIYIYIYLYNIYNIICIKIRKYDNNMNEIYIWHSRKRRKGLNQIQRETQKGSRNICDSDIYYLSDSLILFLSLSNFLRISCPPNTFSLLLLLLLLFFGIYTSL